MALANDIFERWQRLAADRASWESVWDEVIDNVMPMHAEVQQGSQPLDWIVEGPRSRTRTKEIYDATAIQLLDRLSAGIESLVSPQNEFWHGLSFNNPFMGEVTHEEQLWLDALTKYLFSARYAARSGFASANSKMIRSTASLGTGVMFPEEALGKDGVPIPIRPLLYRCLPITECYLSVDAQDRVDTNYRYFLMSPRAAAQRKDWNLSGKLKQKAESDKDKDTPVPFIHAVFPRAERGSRGNTNRDSEFASVTTEVNEKHVVKESGYFRFPYVVTQWNQREGSPYGESLFMQAISDIKSLQVMAKHEMIAAGQAVLPPLAVADDGVSNRPDLNPNAINPGAIDAQGNLKIRPILTATNLPFGEQILTLKRESLRSATYVDLFQTLVQNPEMTATEALIRANEKGELLGPAGTKYQEGYAHMVDIEIDAIDRAGAFDEGARFSRVRPDDIGTVFKSPLDRLRRSNELIGIQRTVEMAGLLASLGRQEAIDKLNVDEIIDLAQEITGAPRRSMMSDEDVASLRDARNRMRQEQAALGAAQQVAEIGKAGAPALKQIAGMNAQ